MLLNVAASRKNRGRFPRSRTYRLFSTTWLSSKWTSSGTSWSTRRRGARARARTRFRRPTTDGQSASPDPPRLVADVEHDGLQQELESQHDRQHADHDRARA